MQKKMQKKIEKKYLCRQTQALNYFYPYIKQNLIYLQQEKLKTKILWQKISEEMKMQGYNASNIQAENKFKLLERSYKNMIINNKKTGRNRTSCPYESLVLLHFD